MTALRSLRCSLRSAEVVSRRCQRRPLGLVPSGRCRYCGCSNRRVPEVFPGAKCGFTRLFRRLFRPYGSLGRTCSSFNVGRGKCISYRLHFIGTLRGFRGAFFRGCLRARRRQGTLVREYGRNVEQMVGGGRKGSICIFSSDGMFLSSLSSVPIGMLPRSGVNRMDRRAGTSTAFGSFLSLCMVTEKVTICHFYTPRLCSVSRCTLLTTAIKSVPFSSVGI